MKKQFQILAATFISVAIVSCSKQGIDMPETTQKNAEEISTSSSSNRPYVDPLTIGLEGRFEFNSNLKDVTKKLADGVPSTRVVSYGTDRHGIAKNALYANGTYFVKLNNVPQQTTTSLSVWVKPSQLDGSGEVVANDLWQVGPGVSQGGPYIKASIYTGVSTPGSSTQIFNTNWHHVVITFDGSNVRTYINNVLKSTIPHSASIPPSLSDFFVGWGHVYEYFTGYIDDLRFYSRTLSAADVQKLYNL